ncbi:endonuclease/exonuclease/phosphatase family protein [Jonesia quinghaiensis]|uniref:endonuclease/exonuclease/phosphatase family protein n=1 Tax=Jonesia quinghaiensis TaxID=262806 RepID=UPI0003FE4D07|nr:endonuclease/exonuclease/phosphatase family protein [Jonesia quinghaiensis]
MRRIITAATSLSIMLTIAVAPAGAASIGQTHSTAVTTMPAAQPLSPASAVTLLPSATDNSVALGLMHTGPRTPSWYTVNAQPASGGRVAITWEHNGVRTTSQRLHLAAATFAPGSKGPHHRVIELPATARSYTLTAGELRSIRSAIGTARDFRFRLEAINTDSTGSTSKFSPLGYGIAGQPLSKKPTQATTLTVASYNITGAGTGGEEKPWAKRRTAVAQEVVNSKAGIVAVQEALTKKTSKKSKTGQINQFLSSVRSVQRKKDRSVNWKMVRTTRYVRPGINGGNDGARILYDANRYKLISTCKQTTKKKKYSTSCAIKLPRIGIDRYQRYAAIAQFKDRKTGKRFWFVSAHLEHRWGAKYDKNRAAQMATILKRIDKVNSAGRPVILAGDLNSSTKRTQNFSTLNKVYSAGFIDTATAPRRTGLNYNTYNNWRTQKADSSGYATRIDFVFARGAAVYASSYSNRVNGYRASDHNLVKATVSIR